MKDTEFRSPPTGIERFKLKKDGMWWTIVVGEKYEYMHYASLFKWQAKKMLDYLIDAYEQGIWYERNYNRKLAGFLS